MSKANWFNVCMPCGEVYLYPKYCKECGRPTTKQEYVLIDRKTKRNKRR